MGIGELRGPGPEKPLYVKLPWALWQAVDRVSRAERRPKTEIVVAALRLYLKERKEA